MAINMKVFIISLLGVYITYKNMDLFSDSIFLSLVIPLIFCFFVFVALAKILIKLFKEPLYTEPTEGEKAVIRTLFKKGSPLRHRIDD